MLSGSANLELVTDVIKVFFWNWDDLCMSREKYDLFLKKRYQQNYLMKLVHLI